MNNWFEWFQNQTKPKLRPQNQNQTRPDHGNTSCDADEPAYLVQPYTLSFLPSITFPLLWIPQPHNTPLQHPTWHPWACMITCSYHPTLIGPITNCTIRPASHIECTYDLWTLLLLLQFNLTKLRSVNSDQRSIQVDYDWGWRNINDQTYDQWSKTMTMTLTIYGTMGNQD